MFLRGSFYHQFLRSTSLLLAMVLLFDSGLLYPVTKEFSDSAENYLANVISVGASVAPNDLNVITAELTKQKAALDEREQTLAEKERAIEVGLNQKSGSDLNLSTYILSVLLFVIIVLISLNYALDYVRYEHLRNLKKDQHA